MIGVLSFCDPFPRATLDGRTVFAGHIGTIYQAHNGRYLGRGAPRTMRFLPDGRVLSARAISKIRARERGWRYAAAQLVEFGADPLTEDTTAWLARWLPRLTRTARHPGNHKYAWTLQRGHRRHLGCRPYPKGEVAT